MRIDKIIGWLLVGLLAFSGTMLGWRHWSGALSTPPADWSLVCAGLLAVVIAGLARWLQWGRSSGRLRFWAAWIPTASLAIFGLALTFPGRSTGAAIGIFWGLLIAEEACAFWLHKICSLRPFTGEGPGVRVLPSEPHVMQQLVRTQAENGAEGVNGWLRIPVEVGQRTLVAHVAFCPPLGQIPQWNLRQSEGPQARLRTTQLLPYGARVELRLDASPAQPTEVMIHFEAQAEATE